MVCIAIGHEIEAHPTGLSGDKSLYLRRWLARANAALRNVIKRAQRSTSLSPHGVTALLRLYLRGRSGLRPLFHPSLAIYSADLVSTIRRCGKSAFACLWLAQQDFADHFNGVKYERAEYAKVYSRAPWYSQAADGVLACDVFGAQTGLNVTPASYNVWFKRALITNPEDAAAYEATYNYLITQRHGSGATLLAFAKSAAATGFWHTGIPWLLVRARVDQFACRRSGGSGFFRRPQVWADIQRVCSGYVAACPASIYYKSEYAYLACLCGHWKQANREFSRMGKGFDRRVFLCTARYEFYRDKAKAIAGQ